MNEQETIPNRIACIDCVPENFIKYTKLEKIYENWQQFTIILESSIRQIQDNYNCNKIEKIQLLQNLKNNCNLFLDQEISVLNSCSIEILESKSQYISLIRKDWQSLTQEEIIQIANILSQTNSFEKIIKKIECEILQDIFQQNEIIENQFKDGKQQIIEYFQKIQLNQIKVKQLDQQLMEKSQLTQRDQVNLKKQINYQLFCSIEDEEINSLEFNKENSLLVTGYNSGIIRVYEFQQSNIKLIQELNEHDEFVCCLQFMHKQISFLSGSLDCSIIIWKVNNQQQWYSSQRLVEHTGCINCIISNFNEDLILSCSFDNTIKCWIQDQQSNWICHQSLNDHSSAVSSLSLNESQNQFISSSNDKTILIYQQQQLNDQLWILKQIIQVEQLGFRLCFINDKLFTFQKQYSDYLDIYELKNKEFTNTIQVSVQGIGECWLYFSQKFIKSKNILINKNGCFLNILQLNDTGQFFNVQQIKFKTNNFFGGISGDGEFLITWDDVTSQIQIRILNEHSLSST
ncbi:unnamed protein product [Paramecium sonneborni]|uniref:WD domain, G-beta repeat protein n=1 Tax=Paramecium sonneborni TaxID=65129 RepID=A0A8S1LUG1_9CILI|nr:unnamed protein product [Paramecium sonneborni]